MTYRKKLIEVALPLEAINIASAREKSIRHGHPSTLHLWWARRPLAACRAVIFSSLVDDPDSPDALPAFVEACKALPKGKNATLEDTPRQRLFDFIELLVQWESTTNEAVLNTARELILIATEGNPPPLLDPFAGGGSIPLEAQRLGLEAHASDLNPVAVMINKAQIEIPPRFANMPPINPRDRERMSSGEGWNGAAGLAADVRYYGEWMREKAWERIGHLYPTHNGETVIAWIWARTVKSPNPAFKDVDVPLVRSFELSKKKGRRVWIQPNFDSQTRRITFHICHEQDGNNEKTIPEGTVNRRGGRCLASNEPIPLEYARSEGKAGRMSAVLMAIVTEGKNGRSYYAPTSEHKTIAEVSIVTEDVPNTNMPDQALGFRLQAYGIVKHVDMFTPRQLATLAEFSRVVNEVYETVYSDAQIAGINPETNDFGAISAKDYAQAVATYLGFTPSKAVRFISTLSFWRADENKLARGFARQTVSMTWDFAETNPFAESGGDFEGLVNGTADVLEKLVPNGKGFVLQHDAAEPFLFPHGVGLVSTDPPYYDNVPYADLSDIFYVWLRPALRKLYPKLFETILVPKAQEMIAEPYRQGGKEKAQRFFESSLKTAFSNIRDVHTGEYPLTVYYAFKQSEEDSDDEDDENTGISVSTGWETMLDSLIKSGFSVVGTWPVRTETTKALKQTRNFLASSIVLVCRPRPDDAPTISRRQFADTLRRELPAALKEMQSGNIAPVDLAQASIGPGMAIYSRYSQVLEADGSPMSVRAALGQINQELDAYLAEQDGDIDGDTRFAIAWFEQFGFNDGEFGLADVLARAKNISVAGVEAAGVVKSGRSKVRLIHWKDYDPGAWDPQADKRLTVWEATHHLIERLNTHGETGAAQLLVKIPHDMAAEARNLAYRLYSICERKGWADHARDYNALVISWAAIGEEAARLREASESNQATEQGRLFE